MRRRCSARRCRGGARRTATGTRTRSSRSTTSEYCCRCRVRDRAGAAPLLSEALQAGRETLGNRLHQSTLTSIDNLGMLLKAQGETVGASALLRELQTAEVFLYSKQC